MSYYIVTDVAGDLPQAFTDTQKDFYVMPMPYRLGETDLMFKPYDGGSTLHDFYRALSGGQMATTSQVPLGDFQKVFGKLLAAGHAVLYIGFSSGLSGSFQSAVLARSMIMEEMPEAKLYVVDSLCASAGQALLVRLALKKRDEGLSVEALYRWVMENRQKVNHWFTVDDLDFLFRGGRLSKASAFFGGMLKIKPLMQINYEGKIIPREKVTGRKRALKMLAEKYAEFAAPKNGQLIYIAHSDDRESADYVAAMIQKLVPDAGEIVIVPMGAIIGAHTGPGTLALFFMGNAR